MVSSTINSITNHTLFTHKTYNDRENFLIASGSILVAIADFIACTLWFQLTFFWRSYNRYHFYPIVLGALCGLWCTKSSAHSTTTQPQLLFRIYCSSFMVVLELNYRRGWNFKLLNTTWKIIASHTRVFRKCTLHNSAQTKPTQCACESFATCQ